MKLDSRFLASNPKQINVFDWKKKKIKNNGKMKNAYV